jgi:transposase
LYFLGMYVRKKINPSGIVSVQVIDKSTGKYKLLKTIGSSSNSAEVARLESDAREWIKKRLGLIEIDFTDEKQLAQQFLDSIEQITVQGTELLLGRIFDEIGFNAIPDILFRHLVIARLSFPASKLKTTDFLSKYQFFPVDVQQIYRYLDKLHKTQKEKVQQISYDHSCKILGGEINIVFYDVTTLYFEIDNEDELRKTGFNKDGKHQNPQIVLGLLVSIDGYPLAYEIFEGNKFEGHTMCPVIDAFKSRYNLSKLVIIADSGLLSKDNIKILNEKGYEFILGARIKAESNLVKERILSLQLDNGQSEVIEKDDGLKLVIGYSEKRAKKDRHNRDRGLKKLEKKIRTGKLTKANINNRGYNKYLELEGEIKVSINLDKYNFDAKWDGLKGYLTNTTLTKENIIESYRHLWKIEKAFRISKYDLKIRPIFHRIQRRIEAHICIAFVAYKVYKELERQLNEKKAGLSPEKAIEIAKTIYSVKVVTPKQKHRLQKTILLTEEHEYLAKLFGF